MIEYIYQLNIIINLNQKKLNDDVINCANKLLNGDLLYFSHSNYDVGKTPNWFFNPYNKKYIQDSDKHWSDLKDFDLDFGDIKTIWDISRFNWLGTLAIAYKITYDEIYLTRINTWLKDWIKHNPQNTGPNWKCAQESSLRLINLIVAQEIIGTNTIPNTFLSFIEIHVNRISVTTFYAKAQDNNHGISEGIALYLGGFVLWKHKSKKYNKIFQKGLKLIENRVNHLIMNDGTFSQYSIVYHRMVLDLLSILELIRDRWEIAPFSKKFYKKTFLACEWYSSMIDEVSGNAPNMGGNDGTHLFNFDQKPYRDFRYSLSLVSSVFNIPINSNLNKKHIIQKIFNKKCIISNTTNIKPKLFLEGGYIKLVRQKGMAIFRVPKYTFRPPHSDAFHIDIWQDGINLIRDAGTYSYALNSNQCDSFSGTHGHSTIEFDDNNQMPRHSRFLYIDWLKPYELNHDFSKKKVSGSYRTKINHTRTLQVTPNGYKVTDTVGGKFEVGIIRFLLHPSKWIIDGNIISNEIASIRIKSDNETSINLREDYESLYYMHKTLIPILEIEFVDKGNYVTNIIFNS